MAETATGKDAEAFAVRTSVRDGRGHGGQALGFGRTPVLIEDTDYTAHR